MKVAPKNVKMPDFELPDLEEIEFKFKEEKDKKEVKVLKKEKVKKNQNALF